MLVILDCDGVLFDSWRANVAYYNAVLAALGAPPLDTAWEHRAHFWSTQRIFDELFADDETQRRAALRLARSIDYTPFLVQMIPDPALEPVLAALAAEHTLAMATNRSKTVADVVRHFRLDRYLQLAVGTHDVPRPKPHPDMLEHCLRHFACEPAAAVFVGDGESDRDAAAAARIPFIGVGPHVDTPHRIATLAELPAALHSPAASRSACP